MKINQRLVAAPLIALACIAGVAQAQEWGGPRGQGVVIPRADLRLDGRYQLNRYYPPQGYVVAALPRGAVAVAFGGLTYYYHAGVWFQPSAGHYVVAMPPQGAVIPTLPAAYATLSFNGVPYYYANETYYIAAPGPGYAVVSPPPDAAAAQPVALVRPAQPPHEFIAYPRNGQSVAQTAIDQQECDAWAASRPNPGANPHVATRAVKACMDGRGYTVR